jgi:tRNA (cytidine/uridine-2'-O-)-methyltransferase
MRRKRGDTVSQETIARTSVRQGTGMQLALYQPDIAPNAAAALRLAACLGVPVHVIEPCGFVWDDRRLRRVGMDYLAHVDLARHPSWEAFASWRRAADARLVLLTTHGEVPHHRFAFRPGDVLLAGRESEGASDDVHRAADHRVFIPMMPDVRSLNVVGALAIVLGEALRQTDGFFDPRHPS